MRRPVWTSLKAPNSKVGRSAGCWIGPPSIWPKGGPSTRGWMPRFCSPMPWVAGESTSIPAMKSLLPRTPANASVLWSGAASRAVRSPTWLAARNSFPFPSRSRRRSSSLGRKPSSWSWSACAWPGRWLNRGSLISAPARGILR